MRPLAASSLLLSLAVVLAGSALAQGVNGEERYAVDMELWIDGEQRGAPTVVTLAGKPASVAVSDAAGEKGWKIELLVEPPAISEGATVGAIWLNMTVHERRDGEWEPLADSLLGVPEGRSAVMSVVEPGTEEAEPGNSLVYLTARASRLQSETPAR